MALTITNKINLGITGRKLTIMTLAFDSSYPTGGESLTNDDLRIGRVDFVDAPSVSGYVFQYDYTNEKLMAYYADYDAGADGALIEVANEADLSGVTGVRILAIGH